MYVTVCMKNNYKNERLLIKFKSCYDCASVWYQGGKKSSFQK